MRAGRASKSAWLLPLLITAMALALAACSGGSAAWLGGGASLDATPEHGFAGAVRSGSFAAVAVDDTERNIDPLTSELTLTVAPREGGGQRVTIGGRGLPTRASIYLHLGYDGARMHPVSTGAAERLRNRALCLGIMSRQGVVALGLTGIDGAAVFSGEMPLAVVDFAPGAQIRGRMASTVNDTLVNDLHFDFAATDTLKWSYASTGDYDQNSEVNVADITPIGAHFKKTPAAPDWARAQLADGDTNNEVNIADLTPIGVHYQRRVTGYGIRGGSSAGGPFSGGDAVPFNAGVPPLDGGHVQFSYQVPAPVEGAWFVVVAQDGAQEAAAHSNAVQYGGGGVLYPPASASAYTDGTNIFVSWTLPVSGTPDAYAVYESQNTGMDPVTTLTESALASPFIVPASYSPATEHYFGVMAVYGAQKSGYAIAHYAPGIAPQNLTGVKVDAPTPHIQLSWTAPGGGEPTGYNVYIGNDIAMNGATKLNFSGVVPGLTYDVSDTISPDFEQFFGIKADYSGTESAFSNIYHYIPPIPGDTNPPIWQGGGQGIKSVAPDDQFVTVTWYQAVDPQTPPVHYLLAYAPEGTPLDWNTADYFDSTVTTTNISGLTNNQRYEFAVKAEDDVAPVPNRTANTNSLFATPMIFPPDGQLETIMASDVASVRMEGEEIPRIVAVNHTSELWYCVWRAGAWDITNLNLSPALQNPDRKYHPQMVGLGNDVHIVFGTQNGVFEFFGDKDADPSTWTLKTIAGMGIMGCTGIGFDHSEADNYFAVVYATRTMGTEYLYYADRNDGTSDAWDTPISVMDGNPEIWQCDLALNEYDGSQWLVAANGTASSSGDDLKFWYGTRASRVDTFSSINTGYGGDVMVVDIDPISHQPIVVDAEVREVDTGFGIAPVSDATVFTWDGSAWQKNVLEQGDFIVDLGSFTQETILTGQDPQVVFSQTGKAVALWSNLDVLVQILDETADMTGDWRFSQRPEATWSSPASMLPNITSSNSVTAGEGYQHCVTCNIGVVDSGDMNAIFDKYSQRNNYVEGDLWYHRQTW